MKIKVMYLNWDTNDNKDIYSNKLILGFVTGEVFEVTNENYRDINEYEATADDDVYDLLENVYEEHNRIDDEHFCRLRNDQRSMCTGDLIFVDGVGYVVKIRGFDKI